MSKEKKTPIFPHTVKPIRPGVYETRFYGDKDWGYSMWSGYFWGGERSTPADAHRDSNCGYQNKEWRGLTTRAEDQQ